MDFKQWLHETKQQLEEAKWREKSLSEDLAAAARREHDLQKSVAEMDATIMGLWPGLLEGTFCNLCVICLRAPLTLVLDCSQAVFGTPSVHWACIRQ